MSRIPLITVFTAAIALVTTSAFAKEPPILAMHPAAAQPKKGWTKMTIPKTEGQAAKVVYVSPKPILTQADVKTAKLNHDPNGRASIALTMTEAGGKKMYQASASALKAYRAKLPKTDPEADPSPNPNAKEVSPAKDVALMVPRPMIAVLIKGELLVAPNLITEISTQCVITGAFTRKEAKRITSEIQSNAGR